MNMNSVCALCLLIPRQTAEAEEEEEKEEEEVTEEPPPKVFRVDPVGTRGAAYGAWETIWQEP